MRHTIWIVLAFALRLGATAIVTEPIQGTASLGGTDMIVDITGAGVNIHFSGDSNGGSVDCQIGVPCSFGQSGSAGNPSDAVSLTGTYKGRVLDTQTPAIGTLSFSSLQTFESGPTPREETVPIDVFGELFFGFPTGAVDLQLVGHGFGRIGITGSGGTIVVMILGGDTRFSGTLTETPEPATAAMYTLAGIGLLALARKRRQT